MSKGSKLIGVTREKKLRAVGGSGGIIVRSGLLWIDSQIESILIKQLENLPRKREEFNQ